MYKLVRCSNLSAILFVACWLSGLIVSGGCVCVVWQYLGDQEDKQWLCERHYMPATGGKSYIVIVDDIRQLAASDEYK